MAEQRWTIWICPECNAAEHDPPSDCAYCEAEGGQLQEIEVVPANHPGLLSREEAKLIMRLLVNKLDPPAMIDAQIAVRARLSSYASEGEELPNQGTQVERESQIALGIAEAAELTPFSASSLYRIAPQQDSPFTKRCGRWVTTPERLREWIEFGPKPRSAEVGSPMPKPRSRRQSSFARKLLEYEGSI